MNNHDCEDDHEEDKMSQEDRICWITVWVWFFVALAAAAAERMLS